MKRPAALKRDGLRSYEQLTEAEKERIRKSWGPVVPLACVMGVHLDAVCLLRTGTNYRRTKPVLEDLFDDDIGPPRVLVPANDVPRNRVK